MNDLFIQGLHIDWNNIPRNSYLRQIDAIKGLDELAFHNPVTFFVGENGSGKSTLLEALAVAVVLTQKVAQRIMPFLLMIPIHSYMKP